MLEMPGRLIPMRNERMCECGHFESRHGVWDGDAPVHDCPMCDCEPERGTGVGECIECDGGCEEFRPVRLCAQARTPLDEWRAYYDRLGRKPPPMFEHLLRFPVKPRGDPLSRAAILATADTLPL